MNWKVKASTRFRKKQVFPLTRFYRENVMQFCIYAKNYKVYTTIFLIKN